MAGPFMAIWGMIVQVAMFWYNVRPNASPVTMAELI